MEENSKDNTDDSDVVLSKFFNDIEDNNENLSTHHHALYITHNLRNFNVADDCGYSPIGINATLPCVCLTKKDDIVKSQPILEDSLLKYINEKKKWKLRIRHMKLRYKCLPEERKITEFKKTASEARIPFYLLKFTNLLSEDPDPYFDSEYNWYYSGNGNLSCINYDNLTYFLKSTEYSCYIISLQNEEIYKYSCENEELIHETVYWNRNIVGLRQKKSIELLSLIKSQSNLKLSPFKLLNSKIPITSFHLESEKRICYSCADRSVYLWDIESDQQTLIAPPQNETEPNRWSHLEQLDENSYLHITDSSVWFKDKRNNNVIEEYVPSKLKSCERISAAKLVTTGGKLLCIGTDHSFQILDIRYINMKRNFFVKHWSHGLKSPPLFLSKSTMDKGDLYFLSNQYSNESSIILDGEKNILPWHPPTIHDTLKMVQKKGHCLDPTSGLKKRLLSSIIGHTFYNNNGLLNSVRLNAYGDMVYQYIHHGICSDNENELCDALTYWSEKLPSKIKFQATRLIDVSQTYRTISLRRKPKKMMEDGRKTMKKLCHRKQDWGCALNKMSNCTDMFAHELFSFWELNSEDFGYDQDPSQLLNTPFNVTDWLTKSEY